MYGTCLHRDADRESGVLWAFMVACPMTREYTDPEDRKLSKRQQQESRMQRAEIGRDVEDLHLVSTPDKLVVFLHDAAGTCRPLLFLSFSCGRANSEVCGTDDYEATVGALYMIRCQARDTLQTRLWVWRSPTIRSLGFLTVNILYKGNPQPALNFLAAAGSPPARVALPPHCSQKKTTQIIFLIALQP